MIENQKPFKIEPASLFRKKLILMLIGFLPTVHVAMAGIFKLMDERGYFPDLLWRYFSYSFIVVVVVIAASISLFLFYRSSMTISRGFNGEFEIKILDFRGKEKYATGKWSSIAQYSKEYFKFGTYQKDLHLTLFCDNQAFCILRYKTAAAESAPEGFTEVTNPGIFMSTDSMFFTPKTAEIYRILKSN